MRMRIPLPTTPLEPLYRETGVPDKIRRSLNLMLYANIFGNLFGVICGGSTASMIGLANLLGAGDLAFGILNGIPQAAMVLELFYAALVNRTHHCKKYMLTFGMISRFMWILFGLIPILMPMAPKSLQLWTLIFLLGISSCLSAAITPCWYPWFSDISPDQIKSRWMAVRDMEVSAASIVFGLLVAWLLQVLPLNVRYPIIFTMGGLVGMFDMCCFIRCAEEYRTPPVRTNLVSSMKNILKNRPFMDLTVMWTVWCFTGFIASAYHGRYCINEMGFSFVQNMLYITMAQMVGTMVGAPRWGRIIHRIGTRNAMMVSCLGGAGVQLLYLLCTPGNIWPPLLANFLGALFWSGAVIAVNTMQLTCSPEEDKPTYIAFFACLTCWGAALGTVIGGMLLEWWTNMGWFLGGFDRYKALTLLSTVLRLAGILIYTPRLVNQPDGRFSNLWKKY